MSYMIPRVLNTQWMIMDRCMSLFAVEQTGAREIEEEKEKSTKN